MINENTNIKDFFFDLTRRGDGRVFLVASMLCLVILCINVAIQFEKLSDNPTGYDKWIVIWIMLPAILFFIHIRLRQLIETENNLAIFFHALIQFGIVCLLLLKNWGIL